MKNILIVEDDATLNNGIAIALKAEDTCFFQAYTKKEAGKLYRREEIHLVILDENLPDGNGLDFLREIREDNKNPGAAEIPVIILTANDMETDIVTGLSFGADDYITKPFSLMVLRARVEVQFRKKHIKNGASEAGRAAQSGEPYEENGFLFDFDKMEFLRNGEKTELSKTEQKLLRILVENRGCTLTRQQLVDRIWTDGAEYVDENALSVTIKRLRDKLENNPSRPEYIQTSYGIGYGWRIK